RTTTGRTSTSPAPPGARARTRARAGGRFRCSRASCSHARKAARTETLPAGMTRVDFHFNAPDKLAYGCRLVRKVYRARRPVLVWCDDEARLDAFDRLLWADPPADFV